MITPAGRNALQAWLGEPTVEQPEIRDPGLLKLFFSELASEDEFHALVREQAAAHRHLLTRYESMWQQYGERAEYQRRNLPLSWGLRMERALVAFWEELAKEPSPATTPTATPSTPSTAGARHDASGESRFTNRPAKASAPETASTGAATPPRHAAPQVAAKQPHRPA
jgi:hypothetical protein